MPKILSATLLVFGSALLAPIALAEQCVPSAVDVYKPVQDYMPSTAFDWSMPDRYAVAETEKFPLLPNTLDYVMNWEAQDGSTKDACPCLTTAAQCLAEGPRYKVTLTASDPNLSVWARKS